MYEKIFNVSNMANELLSDVCELVYVSDMETHEILYVNKNLRDILQDKPIINEKCYALLQGKEQPCTFCTNKFLLESPSNSYSWEYYNPILDKYFLIKDKIIRWDDGRDVRLEYALDISHMKLMEEKLKNRIALENLMDEISKKCLGLLGFQDTMNEILERIGSITTASRVYVFEIEEEYISNTYEWCAFGVSPEKAQLQRLPLSKFQWWMGLLDQQGFIHIDDIDRLQDELPEKEILQQQDIKSLLVFPIYHSCKLRGFIGIDHTRKKRVWNEEDVSLLRVTSQIIGNAIEKNIMEKKLRQSQVEKQHMIENYEQPTIIIDRLWRVIFSNESFREMTKYSKMQIKNLPIADLFYTVEYPRVKNYLKHIHKELTYENIQISLLDREGTSKTVYLTLSKIQESNGYMLSFQEGNSEE